ncbi:ubiquinol-cytochrome C chaperone [Chelatococcus sambhunathii]|uniref:Ubiquinol-cytochrome C chaperone n=1 Tax=Chelatococcus sambhunathii TaxID=363953 RepID=A0ABU1DDH2_9HYPH|nr:ubiquinol-cytochrome C chaperone family protein [Chelatococcus sambhunathii]MDR4306151.1 ubiquinol-cytochrome C chaperone [Chelatococcus sambhunathii]
MFAGLFNKRARPSDDRGEAIYAAIVAAARRPELYRDLGAPDSLPGRFELIVLHAALALRRLRREATQDAAALGQSVFDAMVRTLDANLREIGVGDLSVPKRMKAMAQSFYDGAKAYDAALDAGDEEMLAKALDKNVFGGASPAAALRLARYAVRADADLAARPVDGAGWPAFPPVEEARS